MLEWDITFIEKDKTIPALQQKSYSISEAVQAIACTRKKSDRKCLTIETSMNSRKKKQSRI